MNKFKQYMEIINELRVNKETDFRSQIETLEQGYVNKRELKKKEIEKIKDDNFLLNVKKTLDSAHVQNNHFTWNNSGSKFLISPSEIIEEIKKSEIRPKGWQTTLGPTGKEFKSQLIRVLSKKQIGIDYSASAKEENKAVNFYNDHKEIIDDAFSNLKQGLQYALPIYKNGEIIYYLEKRHGNPYTKFFLKIGNGKPTKFINLIPDGKGGLFTSYPGLPPEVIDFSKPVCLLIDNDNSKEIKNTSVLKIEFEKAIRMQNIKNFIELISNLSKDKNKFPPIADKESFEKQTASLIKKELPANTKNINYILSKYNEIKKDLQEAGYIGDKIINQFMVDYKNNNKSEKEKIDWFYENYINKNPKIKMIFNS